MTASDTADLADRAAATHVVVIGGGMAGLAAALECARVGIRVTLLEASDRLGGLVRTVDLAGIAIDAGADCFAISGGAVRALVDEVRLADDLVAPMGGRGWIAGLPGGGAAPVPEGGMLGIPANPFAADVLAVIGWRGAWRAYADRLRPVLTIGQEHSLGHLVRSRLGARVLDRLVAPQTAAVFAADPDDIDVELAVPGLNAALTRAGSLLGGIVSLQGARDAQAPGVQGIDGGMSRLVAALHARLEAFGATVRTGAEAVGLIRLATGWSIGLASEAEGDSGSVGETIEADVVIVATEEAAARRLLTPVVPALAETVGDGAVEVDSIALRLDAPGLDSAPRGSGVVTVPGSRAAAGIMHATARWGWLAQAVAPDHIVRVSFAPGAAAGLTDDDAIALALDEASALLGVPLSAQSVVSAARSRFAQARPASAIGQAQAAQQARTAVHDVPGLAVTGAWLAGTGLARVVADASAEGDRVRRAVLWADG